MKKYTLIVFTLLLSVMGAGLLISCGTSKNVVYFQDLKPGESEITLPEVQAITVQPEDKISIIVNSRDPQLMNLFNLPYTTKQIGQQASSNNQGYPATR